MKTTMRCYHISLRLLSKEKKRKKEKKMPRVGKGVEKLELLRTAGRNVKWCGRYGKTLGQILNILNTELTYDAEIPLLYIS